MIDVSQAVSAILGAQATIGPGRSVLTGISGIDGSGKGYVTAQIAAALEARGRRVANINIDGWLNLPSRRFSQTRPAEHFYEHAIRFPELFAQLVLPLREQRRRRVVADFAEETATAYRPHTYQFENIDIILLEGIFLLKPAHRAYFDLAVWVDCTFDTALERALRRGQEHLPPAETIRAYEAIYFAAQRIHLARDDPRAAPTLIVANDPRLMGVDLSGGARPPSTGGGGTGPRSGGV
jgi:uridine kinase